VVAEKCETNSIQVFGIADYWGRRSAWRWPDFRLHHPFLYLL